MRYIGKNSIENAYRLFESGNINGIEVGTTKGLFEGNGRTMRIWLVWGVI